MKAKSRAVLLCLALLASCGGGDETSIPLTGKESARMERPLATAVVSSTVFEDSFTRPDSQNLGSPTVGGAWLEANELFSPVSSPNRGTVYPADISLTSGALAFNYSDPQQGFGISHAQPRAYAPLSRGIQNGSVSFTFTSAIGGRTTHEIGLMNAAEGFYTTLTAQDYSLYYPARGLSVALSRSGVQFPNTSVSLLKFEGVGNVTNLGNFPLPFQFDPGNTYAVTMTMAADTFTVTVSNGTQTATNSVTLNGFTFLKDQIFIYDGQAADNGLRFDNFVVVEDAQFTWPVDPTNATLGHDGPCGDFPGPVGCFWISDSSTNAEVDWRDAQPFQRHRNERNNKFHLGADYNKMSYKEDMGEPVYAAADGTVSKVYENVCGWGNIIFLVHDTVSGPITTMYAHVDWLDKQKPLEHTPVTRGQPIAALGDGAWKKECQSTNGDGSIVTSTTKDEHRKHPPHLHFEVREGTNSIPGTGYTPEQLLPDADGLIRYRDGQGQVDPNLFIRRHR